MEKGRKRMIKTGVVHGRFQPLHLKHMEYILAAKTEYDILPFPISCPEYLLQYVPKDATYYMGLCDEWDDEKYKILKDLGLNIEVLWHKTLAEKGVTASWIRSCIATDQEWTHLVPKSVSLYLTEHGLDQRIKRLEQMRMDEKNTELL